MMFLKQENCSSVKTKNTTCIKEILSAAKNKYALKQTQAKKMLADLIDKDDGKEKVKHLCNLGPLELDIRNTSAKIKIKNILCVNAYLQEEFKCWMQKKSFLLGIQNGPNNAYKKTVQWR